VVKNLDDTQCYVRTGDTYERVGIEPFLRHTDFLVNEQEFTVRMVATSGQNASTLRSFRIRNRGTQPQGLTIHERGICCVMSFIAK
jgi:hypothetical protein